MSIDLTVDFVYMISQSICIQITVDEEDWAVVTLYIHFGFFVRLIVSSLLLVRLIASSDIGNWIRLSTKAELCPTKNWQTGFLAGSYYWEGRG